MASYTPFNSEDIVLSVDRISTPIWSTDENTLTHLNMFTSDLQINQPSGQYYVDVYQLEPDSDTDSDKAEVQFAVAYANKYGKGSVTNTATLEEVEIDEKTYWYTPSRTNYGQYRSLVLGDEESEFKLTSSGSSEDFWIISVDRARYKESLINSSDVKITFTDGTNIVTNPDETSRYLDSGRVYNMYISGVSEDNRCGFFLPDIGTILLDVEKVCGIVESLDTTDIRYSPVDAVDRYSYDNAKAFIESLEEITLVQQETVSSNYIFVRAKNSEFNYSTNPTFVTASGDLTYSIMVNQPETYITSVGLYNDAGDLLAVAKLSKPLSKNFTKEALIRIKLDY